MTLQNLQHYWSSFANIDVGKPDAHLLVSFGEDFPSITGNHGQREAGPAAIQIVRKMDPSGHLTLASNTTLKTTVWIILSIFLSCFLIISYHKIKLSRIGLSDTKLNFHLFQVYIEIPSYTKDPSTSRISILVQKQVLGGHILLQNTDIEKSRTGFIPQDMGTFSRSFYFIITSNSATSMDFNPPGNTILKVFMRIWFIFYDNCYIWYVIG